MKTTEPLDRVVPGHTPSTVTSIARRFPGETGSEALERIGKAVLPAVDNTKPGRGRPRKLPRQFAAIVACRTEGMSNQEIADRLNLSLSTISKILYRARRDFQFSDVLERVEHRAVPAAVDNLIDGLEKGDREYTMATLKGVGVFRSHSAVKQEVNSESTNTLRVVFEMPEIPAHAPVVAVGSISANPRRSVVEVIDGEVQSS